MKSGKLLFAGASVAALLVAATGIAFADSGGPTVVLSSSASSTTNLSSIPVSVTFSQPVTGFSSGGITATNAGISAFSGSGANYTFNLNPAAQGTTTVMIPANAGINASSTGNQSSNTLTFNYNTSASTSTGSGTGSTTPVISSVAVSAIGQNQATISWTTDVAASSQVVYGTSLFYGASTTETDLGGVTSHSQTLFGLTPNTLYDFYVSSSNTAGTATSSNMTFTTASSTGSGTGSSTAPVISNISISNITTTGATVNWTTDQATQGTIAYGTSTSYGATTAMESTASMTHSVALSGLNEATLYHFQITSSNGSATATSSDQAFTTNSTASTTPLAIDLVTTNRSDGVADNTFADGWSWTIHFTVPTNEDAFRIRFSDWGNASNSFATGNNVQLFSPQSSNASSTNSAILETGNGNSGWLYLNGDSDPLTPGRQVDLTVQVKIPFGTANGSYSSNFTAQTYPSTATSTAI